MWAKSPFNNMFVEVRGGRGNETGSGKYGYKIKKEREGKRNVDVKE